MEIGVYSGGSLPMWRAYFGDRCHVYGVDIEDACRIYKADGIDVLIGDQADRSFWAEVRRSVPRVDILIDDGGHHPEQQLITLEEMLPHINPGGIDLCEDIHGTPNYFASYVYGLASTLNTPAVSRFLSNIDSILFYPFVVVIEKREQDRDQFTAPKKGTQWQPESL
jgi:hypothetical protein